MPSSTNNKAVVVNVYDKARRQSVSLTVYTGDHLELARFIENALQVRYRTTRLDSRRHKRR